ncbi:DUF3180 domain-containing protein [Tomitella biformata]|uniref:DUF3180 domain-containing protein n=1 Tax=Tomitella biformata TaxID=630403 RepID=UPI001F2F60E3|nr:DUF3180 domain-containing protein [Tomitella biformata]
MTRIRDLLLTALACTALGWVLANSLYGSLPAVHLLVGLPLLVLALAEVGLGGYLRRRIAHREIGSGLHETHPITVARSAVLAKASAWVGVFTAGLWAGLLIYLVPESSRLHAAEADLPGVIIGLIVGALLAAAAVWLERGCVTPPQSTLDGAG